MAPIIDKKQRPVAVLVSMFSRKETRLILKAEQPHFDLHDGVVRHERAIFWQGLLRRSFHPVQITAFSGQPHTSLCSPLPLVPVQRTAPPSRTSPASPRRA